MWGSIHYYASSVRAGGVGSVWLFSRKHCHVFFILESDRVAGGEGRSPIGVEAGGDFV